jgi:hypothetical protein
MAPPPQAPPQQVAAAPKLDAGQQMALLQRLLQLSPEEIEGLPPAQKAQVLAVRQHVSGGGGGPPPY